MENLILSYMWLLVLLLAFGLAASLEPLLKRLLEPSVNKVSYMPKYWHKPL